MANDLLGTMRVEIVGDNSKLDKSIDQSEKKTKEYGKQAKGLSGSLKTLFSGIAFTAILAGIKKVTTALIFAASDAEEVKNKFNVVFGDVADDAREAALRIQDEFKLSESSTEKFLSGVGDITSGLGATGDQALEAAEKITSLGLDINSFANLSGGAEQAVSALTSLFTGEREAAKALGIVINETNLKQYAEDSGLIFKALTPLEKGFLSLELAASQSELAIGDFARSEQSFANQSKIAQENVKDLSVELGKTLLPVATEGIGIFADLTKQMTELVKAHNEFQDIIERFDAGTATAQDRADIAQNELELTRVVLRERKAVLEEMEKSVVIGGAQKQILRDEVALLTAQVREQSQIVDFYSKISKEEKKVADERAAVLKAAADAEAKKAEAARAAAATQNKLDSARLDFLNDIATIDQQVLAGIVDGNGELEKKAALEDLINKLIKEGFKVEDSGIQNSIALAKKNNVELDDEAKKTRNITQLTKGHQAAAAEAAAAQLNLADEAKKTKKEQAALAKALIESTLSQLSTVFGALNQLVNVQAENEISAIESVLDAELELIHSRYDGRIEALKELTQAEQDIKNESFNEDIDRLKKLTEAEKIFNEAKFNEKIAELEAENTAIADLEIAALFAEKARIIELKEFQQLARDEKEANEIAGKAAEADRLAELAEVEAKLLSETTRAEEKAADEKADIEYEAALQSWKLQGLSILADTASAVMRTISQFGLPFGLIPAAGVGIIAGIQTATWAKSEPQRFAGGGIVAGNQFVGDNIPTLQNSGEMDINRSQQLALWKFIEGGSRSGTVNNNNSSSININSMFSLGNDKKLNEAAKQLWPALRRESQRRGAKVGGI